MRHFVFLFIIGMMITHASGQLMLPKGQQQTITFPVEFASHVPPKLKGNAAIEFQDLDILFDGGSHCAEFERDDGGNLMLFFPHPGYWTAAARKNLKQPIAVLTRRDGKQLLVEISPDSALNRRIADLIIADIKNGDYPPDKLATLKRLRDCVAKRTPLKEIGERMNLNTGVQEWASDPFN